MGLFVYGTLLDPDVLARRSGQPAPLRRLRWARLRGWRRVAMRGGRWPTLVRQRGGWVDGALIALPAAAFGRIAAYEGPAYRLTRVVAAADGRDTAALTWIAPAAARRAWKG
ncbi:MAG: hypothetical protein BGO51_25515 [Rhodospirillales bacterium 69-11]|nr:gamma-glutamylcyclotransferase [Rhodospirillales bacterium]OJW28237.1 MAG: hypothetical protein BGO51_25515 [Rhodospirillales bacterium 69-11]